MVRSMYRGLVGFTSPSRSAAFPESMLHVALDHDCKGPPLPLFCRGIGNESARFLGLLHCVLDIIDGEVGSHERLLMRRKGLADAHEGSVRSSRHASPPEIGFRGAKREAVHALVEPNQSVHVVADDLEIVNGHRAPPLARSLMPPSRSANNLLASLPTRAGGASGRMRRGAGAGEKRADLSQVRGAFGVAFELLPGSPRGGDRRVAPAEAPQSARPQPVG